MSRLDEVRNERQKTLNLLKERGVDPYPATTDRDTSIEDFLSNFETLSQEGKEVVLAGRIMSIRGHGGLSFIDIFDGTGRVQSVLQGDVIGEAKFTLFREIIDAGDFIEVRGKAYTTNRGAQSIQILDWKLLSKSMMPLPDEWYGIKDEDERFRRRYLDILLNEEVAGMVKKRSKFWNTMRAYLLERDFVEVETPILENTTGGAEARPFVTHHNALDMDVYLRISAGELWQKRLMVAGLPRVFEIGRIFRNEGMSFEHLQDYTQMEFYMAYADYREGMEMIKDLYRKLAQETFGAQEFTIRGVEVDLSKEWEVYDFTEIIKERFGVDPATEVSVKTGEKIADEELKAICKEAGVEHEQNVVRSVDNLWKSVRREYAGPGFLIGIPVAMEPLAKESRERPGTVERFQVILAGSEMGKGFSELNDPMDQRARFEAQQAMRDAGDEEAQMADLDYVEALEYGMPPTFGFGVSERFFSFLLDKSVREAQIFPLMKPQQEKLSKKQAEAQYRSKRFVVIADTDQGFGVIANAIGQLGISIGGLSRDKLFDTKELIDKDGRVHYVDGLYPMVNLKGDQATMTKFALSCYENNVQFFDFSDIMRKAHSDKEMLERYKEKGTDEIRYLAVGALVPVEFEKDFLGSLELIS